jgi:hypothetical protein
MKFLESCIAAAIQQNKKPCKAVDSAEQLQNGLHLKIIAL